MATPTSPTATRTFTEGSVDEDAIPGEDTSEVTKLFVERLSAWKHAVAYLQDYIAATEKTQHGQGKEYERVLKTLTDPLKEGHQFDQSLGGIAGMFENIRSNTQAISNQHYESAKLLKGTILTIFERLHNEIKHKTKELTKGAGKGSKAVDKARHATQKHIELLGQHTATFGAGGGKMTAADDPYVLQRGVTHRLHKQILEENNNRQDLISVQNYFAQFEAHIIQTIQHGMAQFMQVVNRQAELTKAMYGEMVGTAQRIPLDFEWSGFVKRNNTVLIDPSAPARTVSNVYFPNQDHRATKPVIAGSLERKGKIMRSYETSYYVVTPARFLHEYKSDDGFSKDPVPDTSLYLPDCTVGAVSGTKFSIKGKDASKGKIGKSLSMSHEFHFKAHTPEAAQQWVAAIGQAAGAVTTEVPDASAPSSPVTAKHGPGSETQGLALRPAPLHTEGVENVSSAVSPNAAQPTPSNAVPPGGYGG